MFQMPRAQRFPDWEPPCVSQLQFIRIRTRSKDSYAQLVSESMDVIGNAGRGFADPNPPA